MRKKLLILITVLCIALSAGLFSACGEKIDNEANYNTARAALETAGFTVRDYTQEEMAPLNYAGAVKGFFASRLSAETAVFESVTLHLLPDKKALDTFVKIWYGRSAESYTSGLIFYRGGDAEFELHKSAAQIVYDVIGGTKIVK